MALGALDRRHVARWLRHFRSRRSDAHRHRRVSYSTRRSRSHWSEPGVWCCYWSRSWRADGGPSWPQEVDARRHDHYCRWRLYQCAGQGPAMLFVGQLLVGIGVGIDFPVSSSYVSEILPKPSRARMMVATIACQSVGMLVAAAVTLLLLRSGSAQAWRLFLATEAAVALLFFVLRLSAPESPHWLMSRGKFAEAAQAFHSHHSRATTGSVATYGQPRGACSSGSARKRWATDPVFASLSGAHGAGNYPLVSDGYCYVRRRIVYADNSGSHRNLRKNPWIERARFCSRRG